MRFDKNLSAIHGYLCGDGYVIKNPKTQKHKYYYIGFRNTNETLLKDFQEKFHTFFGLKPYITDEGRCKIQNKDIYYRLTKNFSYYSYEWKLPLLSEENLRLWIRAFFDCEAWVENQPRKSRLIGLDCCNEIGLQSVQKTLQRLGIDSQIKRRKNRTVWRLTICGLQNLKIFQKKINFLHPNKEKLLIKAINSYKNYIWKIPFNRKELFSFILRKGKVRKSRKEIRILSIKKQNLIQLQKALKKYDIKSRILGPWKSSTCSQYYSLITKEENFNERTKNWSSSRTKED